MLTPFRKTFSFPHKSNFTGVLFIPVLLCVILPLAITGVISKVIIFASNRRFSFRTRPHVTIKGLKGIVPFLANGYSPSSVVFISSVLNIIATGFHGRPRMMLRRIIKSVSRMQLDGYLFFPATTRGRVSPDEVMRKDNDNAAAIANTFIKLMFASAWCMLYGYKTVKAFADKIHGRILRNVMCMSEHIPSINNYQVKYKGVMV
jgi:hypothetical protein